MIIQVRIICLSILRSYIYPNLKHFHPLMFDEKLTWEKYIYYIEKGIDHTLSDIPEIIKPKIQQLRDKLINNYTNNSIIRKKIFKYINTLQIT